MSSESEQLDEILGVSFGDIVSELAGVLVEFHIRADATAGGKEGTRGPLLIDAGVLKGLIDGLPAVLDAMREYGADRVKPRPMLLPAWNDGPRWNPAGGQLHICAGFGVNGMDPERGAAVMFIRATSVAHAPGTYDSAEYLMGWSALLEFQDALPKVLRKLEQRTRTNTGDRG